MAVIHLKVITPIGEFLQEDVKSIALRTVEGEMVLLPNHMPIVAELVPSRLRIKTVKDEWRDYAVAGGFLHFDDNHALILSDAVEEPGKINLERAQKAYERARRRLEKKDSTTNMKRAELALKRAINRIDVAG